MQKFERSKVGINLYGQELELVKPSLRKISAMQERLQNPEEANITVFIDFLVECGMPKELAEDIEFDHANDLVVHLCGAKKN